MEGVRNRNIKAPAHVTGDLLDWQWDGGTPEEKDRSCFITFASLSSARR